MAQKGKTCVNDVINATWGNIPVNTGSHIEICISYYARLLCCSYKPVSPPVRYDLCSQNIALSPKRAFNYFIAISPYLSRDGLKRLGNNICKNAHTEREKKLYKN